MKTAVEWYAEQMQLKEKFTQEEFDNITNQAKELEKQQIVDACNIDKRHYDNSEQYYNETFNK